MITKVHKVDLYFFLWDAKNGLEKNSSRRKILPKECSVLKTCLAKVAQNAQKPRGRHLSRPRRPFWGPLAAILDFAGGAALQAVSECPRRRQAGILFICYNKSCDIRKFRRFFKISCIFDHLGILNHMPYGPEK